LRYITSSVVTTWIRTWHFYLFFVVS